MKDFKQFLAESNTGNLTASVKKIDIGIVTFDISEDLDKGH